MAALLALPLGIAALLVAAKAHGRQVRLERERAGYHHVVFGGANPPYVAALWRADRIRFWTTAPVAGALLAAPLALAGQVGLAAEAALLGGPVAGFTLCGLLSRRRLVAAGGADGAGWWLATAALVAAAVAAALV